MKLLIFAALCVAGCASQASEPESCSPPSRATYTVQATPLDDGCRALPAGRGIFENGLLVDEPNADVELLGNGCFSRATAGRTWTAITFNADWSAGEGTYGANGCRYAVVLTRE